MCHLNNGGFAAHWTADEHESVPNKHHLVHLDHFLGELVRHE